MKYKILDCTLRDGGYYNNWKFEKKLIDQYLLAMSAADIDCIELGLRNFKLRKLLKGNNFFCTEEFISKFKFSKKMKLSVMINTSDIVKNQNSIEKTINKLFLQKKKSRIDIVRIASHLGEIKESISIAKILKNLGYKVALNLMQISEASALKRQKIVTTIKKNALSYIDILYLADSLGSMSYDEFEFLIKTFRKYWKKELGVHTHDNLKNASSNVDVAIKNKVDWIDSTVMGMGRGAGNIETEYLIGKIKNINKIDVLPLLMLINNKFSKLKSKYGWGTNMYYFLAAKYKIHPTYIQTLLNEKNSPENLLMIIEKLKKENAKKFEFEKLENSKEFYKKSNNSKLINNKLFQNKDVMIIGPNEVDKNIKYTKLLNNKDIIKIGLNFKFEKNNNKINFYSICHPFRVLTSTKLNKKNIKKIISPYSSINAKLNYNKRKVFDYGLTLSSDKKIKIFSNHCELPKPYALAYTICFCIANKVSNIYLAGLEGYADNEEKRQSNQHLLDAFKKYKTPIKFITKTLYKI